MNHTLRDGPDSKDWNGAALLIIDQQLGVDHPKLGPRNNPDAEQVMLRLLAHWRSRAWPVIHVRHRSQNPDSVFWPHQEGFAFKPAFLPAPGERMLEKATPCAFTATGLEDMLSAAHVEVLVIVGVATNNSVEATARSGGCWGYQVAVVEDACFTFDKADCFGTRRTAQEVHAMSLANLDGEYAHIINSRALLT